MPLRESSETARDIEYKWRKIFQRNSGGRDRKDKEIKERWSFKRR